MSVLIRVRRKLLAPLKGSTLIEVIVAMVIIMTVHAIALAIFINISGNNNNKIKMKAYLKMEEVWIKTVQESSYFDDEYDFDNIIIKKMISPYEQNKRLKVLQFQAFNMNGKLIIEKKQLIRE